MELDRDWLTTKQACEYLQITRATLKAYIDAGKLTASQIVPRGKWRISALSVEGLLRGRARKTVADTGGGCPIWRDL